MNQPDLQSKRLFLRSFILTDARNVQRMAGNINVAKMTLNIPHPYNDGMAEEWIESHSEKLEAGIQLSYAITSLDTGLLFGAISLTHIKETQANLGYWIGEPHWGNGFCTEAGVEVVRYALNELKLQRVYANHLTSNSASGRVMQKMGMKHHSSNIASDRYGKPASVEIYTIKRSESGSRAI